MPDASSLLPSIGHAAAGAGGTVISTLATYPLDLVNTRLKVQRQLRLDGSIRDEDAYGGVRDAFANIYANEGGVGAFFAGLGADLGKSAADSFLFFLFYSSLVADRRGNIAGKWFRARRLVGRSDPPYLRALEELAVGAAAGACAKAFTTPISNVVTRRQTASLLVGSSSGGPPDTDNAGQKTARDMTFGEIMADMRRERGVLGLWAGYSASLVLTLNPSITFFLQQILTRTLVPRERWHEPGARTTFLLAAVSKVFATAATYPFQIAKARVQVSAAPEEKEEDKTGDGGFGFGFAKDTIFATVLRIARAEGVRALYDGMGGELLKGFFSHGTTMLSKDVIHRFIVQLYFALLAALTRYPQFRARLSERMRDASKRMRERYLQVCSTGANQVRQGARYAQTNSTPGRGPRRIS
ncbi:mitochondrial carrier [Trichocladium antarcticum]|uniref:Mitochondrial carrier n=1 Tax=Trichocladium antarcticum TaxID=1450529 RepID=A0AAN6ZEE4_9PEZI|nr:mitochondrial carrier [Trichocladium antarcticum]